MAEPFMQRLLRQFGQLMNGLLPAVVGFEPLDKHSTSQKTPVQRSLQPSRWFMNPLHYGKQFGLGVAKYIGGIDLTDTPVG